MSSVKRRRRPAGPASAARLTPPDPAQAQDDPARIGAALVRGDIEIPGFSCGSHFLPRRSALWEEASRVGADNPLRQNKKPIERRDAAGAHHRARMRRHGFDSRIVDHRRRAGDACRLAQEGAFAGIGLDQHNPRHSQYRQHEAGKPGAAAEIDKAPGAGRDERQELRRIEEMPAPEIAERARSDEVDPPRPLREQRGVGLEPRQCFT
jgi:hypothetical protein